jgi:hypothetical protein
MNVTDLFCKSRRILACLLVTFTGAYGQKNLAVLDKRIRVSVEQVNVDALGDIITRQTGLILSFNSQKIGARQQVRLRQSSYTTRQLLALIKQATGADYTIYQEHVIFHRVIKTPEPAAKKSQSAAAMPVKQAPLPVKQTPPVRTYPIQEITGVRADSVWINDLGPLLVERPAIAAMPPGSNRADSPVLQAPRRERKRWRLRLPAMISGNGIFSPFVQAGIATNETFYANLQVKAGLGIIYGIGSWSSNFSVSGFRYGLGASIPLRNDWRLQLEATTGKLSKEVMTRLAYDTTSLHRVATRTRLHQAGLFVQKSIGQHLVLHGGPVFNHLKNTHYFDGEQEPRGNIGLYPPEDVNAYYTIKPHYTIGSSEMRAADAKIWIGLQLGINYRF